MTRPSPALMAILLLAACDCSSGEDKPTTCERSDDCAASDVCVDGLCVPRGSTDGGVEDGGVEDGGACSAEQLCLGNICCGEGEECVEGFACAPVCENERCGDNGLTCCDAGEVCLDGVVCAADCGSDQAVCGADYDICCDAGDVCLADACVTPGDECGDDFDCLEDDTYCEPTIGRCLPTPGEPLCEVRPEFDAVALEVEWHWPGEMVDDQLFANVITAPVVGDVSGDGVPDVVTPVYTGASLNTTILVAIDGRLGTTLWYVEGSAAPTSQSSPALANLEPSDDALELVFVDGNHNLVVLDGDGSTTLASVATSGVSHAKPSVHDLDRDGVAEIVVGGRAWSFTGTAGAFALTSVFQASDCAISSGAHSVVANLDDDPELEVTCGGVAYDTDGTVMWGSTAGYAAVADLDLDGTAEVVMVRSGEVTVRAGSDGTLLMGPGGSWFDGTMSIPGGGSGGPPTIADFDADGLPEISAAGRGEYAVYDPDCLTATISGREAGDCTATSTTAGPIRWSAVTQDYSSSRTGSSVYDFQGDGVAEVVYNDECLLHIFDGRTGAEILTEPYANTSRTGSEYPIVVDVDRDGNSEIVVPANNDQIVRDDCRGYWMSAFGFSSEDEIPDTFRNGTQGIFVLGDPGDRWVRTRPIWNQFAYAVTHIGDRGAVPSTPADNWTVEGLNNFRQNVQGEGVFNAPNLTVELEVVAACGRRELQLSVVVHNVGSRGVPAGVPVEIVQTAPTETTIATLSTTGALLPGGSERLSATVSDIAYDTEMSFEVRVDGDTATGTVTECVEDDNSATGSEMCQGII